LKRALGLTVLLLAAALLFISCKKFKRDWVKGPASPTVISMVRCLHTIVSYNLEKI